MDITKVLEREEKKLAIAQDKTENKLRCVRAAISALNGSTRGSKLRGRRLSAAHRKAIKLGIARAKKAQA